MPAAPVLPVAVRILGRRPGRRSLPVVTRLRSGGTV